MPFDDNSVDEVRADAILEHLSFLEESQFFKEASRVLKPNGVLNFSVPDFEDTVRKWIDAEDDWRDFYRNDDEAIKQNHWFGHYSYSAESRWGWLITCIFGPQNGVGQFHKNAYTESKIRSMCNKINFKIVSLDRFLWKGNRDLMIRAIMSKK